jgi:hypothetical protein
MSNSGEDLLTLRSDASGTNRYRSPLGRYRQLLASCIRNAHRNVDADERRVSLSAGVIGGTRRGCQASCREIFAPAKYRGKPRLASLWDRPAGPVDESGDAAISP